MKLHFWKEVMKTLDGLRPESVIRESETPFSVALVGSRQEVSAMEDWLAPPDLSAPGQARARQPIFSMPLPLSPGDKAMLARVDFKLAGASALTGEEFRLAARDYVFFDPQQPLPAIAHVLRARPELALALSRCWPGFRAPVAGGIVSRVSKENAAFAILSALPNVVPSPIELPWAIGEFASDTVVLTANQMRMALMIAAAHGAPVGFGEQRGQVLSILGSAFGLRAIARELAGKVPAGGGLVIKGLIAYAGTYTLGVGLARWHRTGRRPTLKEKRLAYKEAYLEGRDAVENIARKALTGKEG
jgi:uncharacterized protein (DUF697 family)